MIGRFTIAMASALLILAPQCMRAQAATTLPWRPEVRTDVILGNRSAVQLGAGVQIPFGAYVRLGADAALGARIHSPASLTPFDGRVDVLTRFLLDPYRQSPYGFSAGAGLGARFDHGERVTPLLLLALELEGRYRSNSWVPALQLGLGGGARIGLVLRKSAAGMR